MTLREILLGRIRQSGPISFEEYMRECLYHPEHGYYASGAVRIGRGGDFYTNSSVHALYGWTLADYFLRRVSGVEGPLTVLELGGGEGHFARDFLHFIAAERTEILSRLHYVILESSPALRACQEAMLRETKATVSWAASISEMAPFGGLVFANEFFDAFPVRRFRWAGGRWQEIFVGAQEGGLVEVLRPADPPADMRPAAPQEGDEFESSESRTAFLERLIPLWTGGLFVIVDYGADRPRLIQRYARGTVLAYAAHRASEDLYENPGGRDLTAYVDFSALADVFCRDPSIECRRASQAEFLVDAGILDLVNRLTVASTGLAGIQIHAAMKSLLHPEGMGSIFQTFTASRP